MAHATLSPSGWARWSVCPGSVLAEPAPGAGGSSAYADEGTAAHWVLEQALSSKYVMGFPQALAAPYLGQRVDVADEGEEPRLITVDQEMVDYVQEVIDYVDERVAFYRQWGPVTVYPERRVNPAVFIGSDNCAGTEDVSIHSNWGVEVVDLKYGRGVVVDAHDGFEPNGQLMLYLLGDLASVPGYYGDAAKEKGYHYRITIAQPRAPHADGPIRSYEILADEVDLFIAQTREAVAQIEAGAAHRVASEKGCRWCPAKATCPEHHAFVGQVLGAPIASWSFDDLAQWTTRPPESLEDDEIVRILDARDLVMGLFRTVEEYAHNALFNATASPLLASRYKLVTGQSYRRWAYEGEDTVAKALQAIRWKDPASGKSTALKKAEIFEEKLRSPTQMEKIFKSKAKDAAFTQAHWDAFKRLVTKPEGSLKLVPVSDERQSKTPKDPATMFADLVL